MRLNLSKAHFVFTGLGFLILSSQIITLRVWISHSDAGQVREDRARFLKVLVDWCRFVSLRHVYVSGFQNPI